MSSRSTQDSNSGQRSHELVDDYHRPIPSFERESRREPLPLSTLAPQYQKVPRHTPPIDIGSPRNGSSYRERRPSVVSIGRGSTSGRRGDQDIGQRRHIKREICEEAEDRSTPRTRSSSIAGSSHTDAQDPQSTAYRDSEYILETKDWASDAKLDPLTDTFGKLVVDNNLPGGGNPPHYQDGNIDSGISSASYKGKGKRAESRSPNREPRQPQSRRGRHIPGTEGDAEKLDPSYKVRLKDYTRFFRPGRVFMTLWTDASTGNGNDTENNQFMSRVLYDERVYTKIRRFVVVRLKDRCCHCLPVTTYDGRGYKKRGIKLEEHGLIYSGQVPGQINGITKTPLRVKLSSNGGPLRNPSYINYGRISTVDTNVKVKDVGVLDDESLMLLISFERNTNYGPEDENLGRGGFSTTSQSRDTTLAGIGTGVGFTQNRAGSHVLTTTADWCSDVTPHTVFAGNYNDLPTTPFTQDPRYNNGSGYHHGEAMPTASGKTIDSRPTFFQNHTNSNSYAPPSTYTGEQYLLPSGQPRDDSRFSHGNSGGPPTQPVPRTQDSSSRYSASQYSDDHRQYDNRQPSVPAHSSLLPDSMANTYSHGQQQIYPPTTWDQGRDINPAAPDQYLTGSSAEPSTTILLPRDGVTRRSATQYISTREERNTYLEEEEEEDDNLQLPSLEEANAIRRRRPSGSTSHRSHGSQSAEQRRHRHDRR